MQLHREDAGIAHPSTGCRLGISKRHDIGSQVNVALWWIVYVCLFSTLSSLVLLYRMAGESSLSAFWASNVGVLFMTLVVVAFVSSIIILRQFIRSWAAGPRYVIKRTAFYLVLPLLLLTVTELTVRLLAVETPWGTYLGQVLLYPREWDSMVAQNRRILQRMKDEQSYLIIDDLLGWTVGADRRSADGLFYSSAEGIRSSGLGVSFAEGRTRSRIALVGDSMTFDEEVKFEDSWGHQLNQLLGPDVQVLNFGVPGYGVDQMYLRYKRDVRPWNPDIVILSFINHDLMRTLWVYPFIGRPKWELPTMKPRFVFENDRLRLLNVPLPPPEKIFAAHSVRELPFVEYDVHYSPLEWDRPAWQFFHLSYAFRTLASLHPPLVGTDVDLKHVRREELDSVNGELFGSFVELVTQAGAIPIVVYLPTPTDYMTSLSGSERFVSAGLKILRDYRIEHVDLTSCVAEVDRRRRFSHGEFAGHYSTITNRAVAQCLGQVVRTSLPTG